MDAMNLKKIRPILGLNWDRFVFLFRYQERNFRKNERFS
ncbi:hypothetical protein LEP1GSC123_3509 [Leptospira borgpetersenii str. 200701203]|uniref:Uncharacterized protein n=1 Tax=Leptospira borgpetersenii str. 200701203 TaxID=1193007 RepID=M3GKZ1_LEPBO|nr:hypothetical protein LEP1GSC123_3509 [Leptospira borgpetersenii str. 200701203]